MRIIFFGNSDISAYYLERMINWGYQVVAVVTNPDKPAGRGLKLRSTPVKQKALEYHLPVIQSYNLNDPATEKLIRSFEPDVQVVVAFNILPRNIWQIPPKGTVNLHFSYLPNYRGAAPINWVIINGESYTGVSTFFIDDNIDTGNIILRKRIEIEPTDTAGTLYQKLLPLGWEVLNQTLELIQQDKVQTIPQQELLDGISELKYAPKLTKDKCKIDWNKPAVQVYNFIRGLSPWPGAWVNFYDQKKQKTYSYTKIYKAQPEVKEHNLKPATVVSDDKTYMKIAVPDGFINILELQLPGKNPVTIQQFLLGHKPSQFVIL